MSSLIPLIEPIKGTNGVKIHFAKKVSSKYYTTFYYMGRGGVTKINISHPLKEL